MKILNKYISDGTVLDIIWKSLKAGYMEDEIVYETESGTMQGGVISPLIANIYLNELDWELEKENLHFVRYADDSIVMCRSEQELKKAKEVVKRVLMNLDWNWQRTRRMTLTSMTGILTISGSHSGIS